MHTTLAANARSPRGCNRGPAHQEDFNTSTNQSAPHTHSTTTAKPEHRDPADHPKHPRCWNNRHRYIVRVECKVGNPREPRWRSGPGPDIHCVVATDKPIAREQAHRNNRRDRRAVKRHKIRGQINRRQLAASNPADSDRHQLNNAIKEHVRQPIGRKACRPTATVDTPHIRRICPSADVPRRSRCKRKQICQSVKITLASNTPKSGFAADVNPLIKCPPDQRSAPQTPSTRSRKQKQRTNQGSTSRLVSIYRVQAIAVPKWHEPPIHAVHLLA